ncbi:MAG TPA: hypothetical protein VED01_24465 [Burkholderiales bacterium]|nr:hypothetical protein [Burkholderiales bacterium]
MFDRSPDLPAGFRWPVRKGKAYESDVDALIRTMLERQDIREDQQAAWDRWWTKAVHPEGGVTAEREGGSEEGPESGDTG